MVCRTHLMHPQENEGDLLWAVTSLRNWHYQSLITSQLESTPLHPTSVPLSVLHLRGNTMTSAPYFSASQINSSSVFEQKPFSDFRRERYSPPSRGENPASVFNRTDDLSAIDRTALISGGCKIKAALSELYFSQLAISR